MVIDRLQLWRGVWCVLKRFTSSSVASYPLAEGYRRTLCYSVSLIICIERAIFFLSIYVPSKVFSILTLKDLAIP